MDLTYTSSSLLHGLPRECLFCMASYLNARDLCTVGMLCTEFRDISRDESLWESLCRRQFNVPLHCKSPPSWRRLYRFNYELLQRVLYQREYEANPWTITSTVVIRNL